MIDNLSYADFRAHSTPAELPHFRPSWDEYFMSIALQAATRSTCLRRMVGAVLVQNNQIVSHGYNSSPSGFDHAKDVGCFRDHAEIPSSERVELCRGLHAEQNAILLAARRGIAVADASLYCTHSPCIICQKLLINVGVRQIYYFHEYDETDLIRAEAEAKQRLTFTKLDSPFIRALSAFLTEFSDSTK